RGDGARESVHRIGRRRASRAGARSRNRRAVPSRRRSSARCCSDRSRRRRSAAPAADDRWTAIRAAGTHVGQGGEALRTCLRQSRVERRSSRSRGALMKQLPALQARLLRTVGNFIAPGGTRGALLVLIYHRVLTERDPILSGEPTADEFAAQMDAVAATYNVLPL